MRAFKGFKVWVAVLLVAVASWAQSGQVLNMEDLKAQIDAFNTGHSDITITIGADIGIKSPLEINNYGYTLTMQSLTSPPRKLTRAIEGNLFTITKGSLTLQNITIDGNKIDSSYANARGSLVFVGDGGIFNMLAGTTLQNNASDKNGSGVYVDSRGKFNMSGGTITGNKTNGSGGGVYIYALRATFNMSGGIIANDTCGTSATSYSGGVHFANSPFATDTDPDKTASVFRLGGTAVIRDNAKGNGILSNVYMAGSRYITLGDGTDGVPAPTGGMEVWITKTAEHGLFVNKGAKPPNPPSDPFGDTKYFQADAGSQVFYQEIGKLTMVPGYDLSLSQYYLRLTEMSGYAAPPERKIDVTNTKGILGKLTVRLSGEYADKFVLDTTGIKATGIEQSETQSFTVKPILGLESGTYSAIVLISASAKVDSGQVIMRRLDVDFVVREYVENRILYFNQSDGKFYASDIYTEIDSLPSPSIFVPENEIRAQASWDSETNKLKLFGENWTTTAPYALYFCQPTPVTLELVGNNSFVSTSDTTSSAGIVSRNSLTIIGDSLKAQGGDYGIFSHALTINSGTFIASGGTTAMQIEKDVVLRTPPEHYDWWYTSETNKGSGTFIYDINYKWIKIEVPPPDYELETSVNNSEPFVDEKIEVTLTVKDITTGKAYESISGLYNVVLTGVPPETFEILDTNSVQFDKGAGKLNLKPKNPGKQILHFSLEHPDYPAINPIVITPLLNPAPPPEISIHKDSSVFKDTLTHGYPAQPPVNIIVENKNPDGHPTGELTVKVTGKDSTSFVVSTDKVPTIPAGGSTVIKIQPLPDLDAKTHTATVVVDGDRVKKDTLVVSFTVAKALGAKVATPILANETAKSVFIYSIPKPSTGQEVEYAISTTSDTTSLKATDFVTFGSSLSTLEFSSLPNSTSYTYYIFARSKENTNYEAGTISEPMQSCIPFNEIAVALWGNNTLTVINNRDNNVMGTRFSNFIWFFDNGQEIKEIGRGQSLSASENYESFQPGKYHVEMESFDGKLISCKYEIPDPDKQPPIAQKTSFIDFNDVETVDVYSISGKRLARLNAQGSFPAEIRNIKNAYVLVLKTKAGGKKIIKTAEVLR